MDPILDDLNPAQRAAVEHGDGPLMVVAGAGSGKTRVITRRIARLVRDGVPPARILALTFTNKAAGEMARRVESLGGDRVHVSTFHSACARFLRHHADRLGFPSDFSIYDTQDRDAVVKHLMGEYRIRTEDVRPAAIGRRLSQLKNLGVLDESDLVLGMSPVDRALEKLWSPYQQLMLKLGAMDFDDLLGNWLKLLKEWPDVAEDYQRRFRQVLVDEFQDTNRVQYDLLTRMVGEPFNLCVVGDPDQSIYRFRGAEIRNMLDFQNDYEDTVVVRLEQNYRSTRTVLSAAESVIANNVERLDKTLETDNEDGAPIVVEQSYGPNQEARQLAEHISGLIADGIEADEIAVFFRSHHVSRGVEEGLRNAALPYRIVGGLSFFERREIKDLIAYLRVLVNPTDDISMSRIINVPTRGVGRVTIDKIRGLAADRQLSLCEAVCDPGVRGALGAKARNNLETLGDVIERAREKSKDSAFEALRIVVEGVQYIEHVADTGDPEDIARRENIAELHSDAATFDEEVGGGLSGYLQRIALMTSEDRNREDQGPSVSVMTVHAAKGLEFDHVFVVALEEGLFPNQLALDEPGGLEEERRLMYVALTRARKTLHLSWCRERMVAGRTSIQDRSCFLRELPRDLILSDESESYEDDFGVSERVGREDDFGGGDWGQESTVEYEDESQESGMLRPGLRVLHHKYGQGTIVRCQGSGLTSKVTVDFDDEGEKILIPEYARLRIVPGFD